MREPTRYSGSLRVDDHTVANRFLRVSVEPNGTLSVTHTPSGQRYEGLLALEDCADIGDGWHRGIPVNDQVYTSRAARAEVAVLADGMARATLRIRISMDLPKAFLFDRMVRSDERVPLSVTHDVTVRKDVPYIEVQTEVENTVRDHRLRVLCPSGAQASTYLADAAFDVVERPIALRADNDRYKELELETKPQQSWTAVHDGTRGLAVVATGLPESAVMDEPDRAIALTLLRSFDKTPFRLGEPGGQIQGRHIFRYLLVPLEGTPDRAGLCRLGQQLAGGLRAVQMDSDDRKYHARQNVDASLPARQSFLQAESDKAVMTSVQQGPSEDEGVALVVRLFNPTDEAIAVPLRPWGEVRGACLMSLEGQTGQRLTCEAGGVRVPLGPKQIQTVRIDVR
jgi:alpha-mannosidase/mannosylglycerate hydrolase